MKTIFPLFLLIFLSFIGSSCTKQRKTSLIADIRVYDASTGQPLQAFLKMTHYENPLLSAQYYEETLGTTDENERLTIERKISRRSGDYEVKVMHPQAYGYINWPMYTIRSLNVGSDNNLQIGLEPRYPYTSTLSNSNCAGPTDSVWVEFLGETPESGNWIVKASGCDDTTDHTWSNAATSNHEFSEITFEVTSKKSGVINTFSETHHLQPAVNTDITISY